MAGVFRFDLFGNEFGNCSNFLVPASTQSQTEWLALPASLCSNLGSRGSCTTLWTGSGANVEGTSTDFRFETLTDYSSIATFQQLVELKDFKPPTRKEYLRYVRRLADHFQCDPATLSQDQVRQYFLFLRQHKQFSGLAMSIGKAAFKLFFGQHLGHADWKFFGNGVATNGLD